jgi:class 3 adenylate cyclase
MQRRTAGRGLGAVLFTDIVGSTAIAAEMGNTRWSELVVRHHRIVRRLLGRFGGHEVDTAGDGFFATFERPADAIRCAVAATEAVRQLGIEIRAGVSFGELETTGRKPSGLVVNTAARVMSVAGPGEVLVPGSVREIVPGAGIAFTDHGVHKLKGLEGEFRLSSVTGVDGAAVAPPLDAEQAAARRRDIFPAGAKRTALFAGLAAGILAIVAVGWILLGGPAEEPRAGPGPLQHSVVKIDAESGRILSRIPIGAAGRDEGNLAFIDHPIVAGEGGVWLLRPSKLLHLDPVHEDIRSMIEVGVATSQTVDVGFDAIWVLTDRTVYRVHPGTDQTRPFFRLPPAAGIATYGLAIGEHIWVVDSDGTLVRMDPTTGARDRTETDLSTGRIAATDAGLWVADILSGALTFLDAETLRETGDPVELSGSVDQVITSEGDLWVLDNLAGTVTRVNTISRDEGRPIRVGQDPTDMSTGLGAVWVGDRDGSLYRLDAVTLDVQAFPIGSEVLGVAVDERAEAVWVYVGAPVEGD